MNSLQSRAVAHTMEGTTSNCNLLVGMPDTYIVHPATRRIRTLGSRNDLVYVGANPILKKTTKMLRKRSSVYLAKQKFLPKRASKTVLTAKQPRKANKATTLPGNFHQDTNTSCRAPTRKNSNPFLRGGLVVVAEPVNSNSNSNNGVLTRSRSRLSLPGNATLSAFHPPSMPKRKTSFSNDWASSSSSLLMPSMPQRKSSNASLDGSDAGPMTRSRSKQSLTSFTAAPRIPCRQESVGNTAAATNTTPATHALAQAKQRISFTMDLGVDQWDISKFLTAAGPMTRSRSRQSFTQAPPKVPLRKRSFEDMFHNALCAPPSSTAPVFQLSRQKVSFMDLEWDKLGFGTATSTASSRCDAPPKFPRRGTC